MKYIMLNKIVVSAKLNKMVTKYGDNAMANVLHICVVDVANENSIDSLFVLDLFGLRLGLGMRVHGDKK